jgi:hypothetical protein
MVSLGISFGYLGRRGDIFEMNLGNENGGSWACVE